MRTKALSIPREVKKAVAERDSCDGYPCCIWCGKPALTEDTLAFSNAHFISRAQGGKGIEENILTLCPDCHRKYDQTTAREGMKAFFRGYLRTMYPAWDENKIYYKKGE
jgi:5-methylcytosine-specific restriction endonuclease McrA